MKNNFILIKGYIWGEKMEFYDLGITIKELRIKKIYHNPNYVMGYVHKVKLARLKRCDLSI